MRPPKLLIAALGLVAVATAATPGWGPYVVRSGDNLWTLARAHHTTVAALEHVNHLRGSTIYAGQTLEIPGLGAGVPAVAAPHRTTTVARVGTYVVRPGDTLTAIARAEHTTVPALASLNHLSGRLLIRIGQTLRVPAKPVRVVVPARVNQAGPAGRLATAADPGPTAIRSLVVAEAQRQHLSPALAQAIATQESGFRMRIVSPTGALGVMQLEPATAQWLSGKGMGTIDPYNLTTNIRGGVLLLRILLAATHGNQPQAIAAYYEGLGAVRAGHMYSNTAGYVANVQALERRYA